MVKSHNLSLYSPNENFSSKIAVSDSSITETNTLAKTIKALTLNIQNIDSNGNSTDSVSNVVATINSLGTSIAVERNRINTILSAADPSVDTFVEVKSFVESLDTNAIGLITALTNRVVDLESQMSELTTN